MCCLLSHFSFWLSKPLCILRILGTTLRRRNDPLCSGYSSLQRNLTRSMLTPVNYTLCPKNDTSVGRYSFHVNLADFDNF